MTQNFCSQAGRKTTLHGFISVMSEWERASPVNKGTDDAHGQQQLEHQGQVNFPDEACG